jgi:uncharacterized protein YtpQ (UPF0354 family)
VNEKDINSIFPRLYPILPKGVPVDMTLAADDSPVGRPLAGDVMIFYGRDVGTHYELVSEKNLRELNISCDHLHKIAVENLSKTEKEIRLHKTDNFSFIICDGNLEASLLLHTGIWDYVQEQIGGDVLASVPARDLLLISGTSKDEISALKKKSCEALEVVDRPLSSKLFLRIVEGWKEYEV